MICTGIYSCRESIRAKSRNPLSAIVMSTMDLNMRPKGAAVNGHQVPFSVGAALPPRRALAPAETNVTECVSPPFHQDPQVIVSRPSE